MLTWVPRLSNEQIRFVQAQSHALWAEGHSLDSRISRLYDLLDYRGGKYLHMAGVMNEKGELVCSCKMYTMLLRVGGRILKTHGFGAVYTPEHHRKKGYAEFMIKNALEHARQTGHEAAVLFSDIGAGYYEKFGYVKLPSSQSNILVRNIPDSEKELSAIQDPETGVEVLERGWPRTSLGLYYTQETYEFYRLRNSRDGFDYVLWDGERRVGFVQGVFSDQGLCLQTFSLEDVGCWMAAWSFLKKLAIANGKKTIYGWWEKEIELPGTSRTYRGNELPMVLSLSPSFDLKLVDLSRAHLSSLGYF